MGRALAAPDGWNAMDIALTASHAPTSLEGLTAAWLTSVLSRFFPGVRVARAECLDAIHGTATKVRLRVTYESDHNGLPATLIVKGGFAAHREAMSQLYAHEVRFYRDLQPRLGVPSPACLATVDDFPARQHIAILEDLTARNVTFCRVENPLTYDQAAAFLDILARLHGAFWNSLEFAAGGALADLDTWMPLPPPLGLGLYAHGQLEPATWAHYMALPRCLAVPRMFHDLQRMRAGLEALNDFSRQGPVCLLHADFHLGNLYHEADGSPGVLDWQSYAKGHWSHDVTYFLVSALDPVDRRHWESALVGHYLSRLSQEGVAAPPTLDEAMQAFRIQIIDGLFYWMINPQNGRRRRTTAPSRHASPWPRLITAPTMLSETAMATLSVGCAPNFRDLGGLPAADGRRIRTGLLFRSEAITAPPEKDAAILIAQRVRFVCDLRTEAERAAAPNLWWRQAGANILHADIAADIRGTAHWDAMRAEPGEGGAVMLMRLAYRAMPAATAIHLGRILAAIASRGLPMVIHCTAGKDRTGFVIALLLTMLGVPRDAIYADYLASAGRQNTATIERTSEIMRAGLGFELAPAALAAICSVRADYLDESFAAIAESHGSVDQYFAAAGLDSARRTRIRNNLLD